MLLTDPVQRKIAQRMRWSLLIHFGLFGVFATAWAGRAPSVQEALRLSVGALGTVIVVGSIGGLIAVALSGKLVPRWGSRIAMGVGAGGAFIGMGLMSVALLLGNAPLFVLGVLITGFSGPFTNVTCNLEGARVEKLLDVSALPQMHAAFPIGAALGSALAALTARLNINVGFHLLAIIIVGTIARALLLNSATQLSPGPERPELSSGGTMAAKRPFGRKTIATNSAGEPVISPWREPRTVMLGVLLIAASLSEGAASNWLNLSVVQAFRAPEEYGALAYATFVISMLAIRLTGARLLRRFGRVKVLYFSGAFALAGLGLFTISPVLPLAWVGIVLWGLGAAMVWPVVMGAAADDPERAAARVAVASAFSSTAMLVAPPLLGMLGDTWGLRRALMLILIPMVVAMFVMRAARPLPGTTAIGDAIVPSEMPELDDAEVPFAVAADEFATAELQLSNS